MSAATEIRVISVKRFAQKRKVVLPLAVSSIPAGFPSPAEDFRETLDIAAHVAPHPISTYFLRVMGDSMTGRGIFDGDMIVVDRSLEPQSGDIVVAVLNGEFMIKTFRRVNGHVELCPENKKFRKITIAEEEELVIWGVVTGCYKDFR